MALNTPNCHGLRTSTTQVTIMNKLQQIPAVFPRLYDVSDSIKVVEVAKKYEGPEGAPIRRIPEYTIPQGSHEYHCSKVATSWTQGFFPGLVWLVEERRRLLPEAVESSYSGKEIMRLARRYQESFKFLAKKAINHDQGFRFQLCYGMDFALTGDEEAKRVLVDAADSLVELYTPQVGCMRSWTMMRKANMPDLWREDNLDEHYLVIIDNLMNLDMLYEATELTGDPKYAQVATHQAEKSLNSHVRPDYTTYHVVDFNQDGSVKKCMTHQGYADESAWSRGQSWAIYGYAQCALRTGRKDFLETACKLADKFFELLPESGVPWWDFDAPKPCPYDASAGAVTACGLLMLYRLLRPTDPRTAEQYLTNSFKLVDDLMRECRTGKATLEGDKVIWGEGAWETILEHSTINGNELATKRLLDHGLVYADFYFMQYGNELLKLRLEAN
ncbi:glycosyl hydrolase family 88 [Cryptococcus neoformans C23]|uniref:Glycosyl hydrolase family 88 n=2 Tax=Cryptococcus neoformans (strain H99 / ATCC 208821 / CBS 10515 / FGSC 9487) TaxID=235443 RepID=J9VZW2_CRYN9|nr:glycosyl hydrolase family 88 [Cryptococcus neoformans var. grubii H99]AUB28341.1 glycosyl hydrolase family 88 [Cryptococcus neoformans var. grubii]OWZ27364.1 glycosyl hydrolase family 88 [Cryptococcus neoformans var. grubii AD2-60a]OWZ39425.1 glycosyl hydrolase family 88 [Cryptococcus neoformans var. grubii C23]OWZ78040.1 glycosyl hydrolase family 88 [Cryptococcus neoformans var. grubii Bt85]OXC81624.1 glycosyl hydrolase family 88 [Cryptococcus neoformans var. grubii AD1-7a]OXG11741.1 glyc|eukprot:XP_012052955.1 glycosyl hydrolase family 88 [Cryptococcus neoformans var. grubii H99]